METSTHIVLGQTGDYEWNQAFSSGGWFMLRSAPNYTSTARRARCCRRWIPRSTIADGIFRSRRAIVSVELVNQGPKDLANPKPTAKQKDKQKPPDIKEAFQLSNAGRSDGEGSGAQQAEGEEGTAKKKEEKKPKKKPDAPKAA